MSHLFQLGFCWSADMFPQKSTRLSADPYISFKGVEKLKRDRRNISGALLPWEKHGMLVTGAQCLKGNTPAAAVAAWFAIESYSTSRCRYKDRDTIVDANRILRQRDVRAFQAKLDKGTDHGDEDPSSTSHGGGHREKSKRMQTTYDRTTYGNRLKQQWTVPRTNLNHYPEETRKVIQQKQHATTMTSGHRMTLKEKEDPLVETCKKCQAALDYERHMEYTDFIGRNGEHFSSWMNNHLQTFESLISAHPEAFDITTFTFLMDALTDKYLRFESRQKRQNVVEQCEQLLQSIQEQLSKMSRENKEPDRITAQEEDETESRVKKEQRMPKLSTSDFRNAFMQTALEAYQGTRGANETSDGSSIRINGLQGDQRTELWKSLRNTRLTASAFSKALGFFPGDRVSLWEEKIGVREPFKGNDATRWGTMNEPKALLTYERLTGQKVESCMFKVKKDDVVHDWLGASPDGLVTGLGLLEEKAPNKSKSDSFIELQSKGPGVLEIKCPYNKGRPDLAEPPTKAIWYYMPQIQGLMDVFDREWCALYVWTPNHGSSSFIISRDREYWGACFDVLAEFWWSHAVPARQIRSLQNGDGGNDILTDDEEMWMQYRPSEAHPKSEILKEWSKKLAWSSPGKVFPHVEMM